MDAYFHIPTQIQKNAAKRYQYVNQILQDMSKEELAFVVQNFGLFPVQVYLHTKEPPNDISGFVRYLDNYLLIHTGGSRINLQHVGRQITGKSVPLSTFRLMRAKLLLDIFATYGATA